jgi:hypothetical protein
MITLINPSSAEETMADDLQQRGNQDRIRINLHEEHEVRYWTEALGVSTAQLQEAVKAAGPMAEAVRAHLKK